MSVNCQTVLIVDDDPQVLRLVEQMLRARSNVKILMAPRAAEALRICEREPVDLLISDVSMPEMNGDKLADRVLKLLPETRVLLITGMPAEPPSVRSGHVRLLKKPFFPSQLLQALSELLD
jgi:two-component system, cell cycle sensor histidine kinase and response regulator CckA